MPASTTEVHAIELVDNPRMNRIKDWFQPKPVYAPIDTVDGPDYEDEDDSQPTSDYEDVDVPFSWIEYGVFLLLGVAMLWAWNMFMAAAPYFHTRFETNKWILNHFQPAEVSVSTITNLVSMLVLSKLQENASYPKRITLALVLSSVAFSVLALSTLFETSASVYFGFLLVVIFFASFSTGLIQNGVFAFAAGFGKGEYMQSIMTGQGVAGVLPPLVQIISVAVVQRKHSSEIAEGAGQSPTSAFIYFLTAVLISILSLLAFLYLLRRMAQSNHHLGRHHKDSPEQEASTSEVPGNDEIPAIAECTKAAVPLTTLFKKLTFLSVSVFLCFAVTMVFPVFTTSIFSTSGIDSAIFIPLAFLLWNLGDLSGRLITAVPRVSLTHYPFALFCVAMARLLFIPLYFLCNIKDRGAIINSDIFYLVVVQFLFGLSNGYLGSQCMMGASDWVLPEEREAAGGFMGLMLVGGLTAGSLLSFLFGDI